MNLAPVILFAYRRPAHVLAALQALEKNALLQRSELYIFCDGPKTGAGPEDLAPILKTREVIASRPWCPRMHTVLREENYGLQRSVMEGVSIVMQRHGKAIVVEDDIVVSPYFLQYMNDALDLYAADEKVLSIGAFNFFATTKDVPETFFIPIPDCWGWATWKDRWDLFEPDAGLLLRRLREKGLMNDFNLEGKFDFESMLHDQLMGKVSSWAIRWQALAYLTGKLSLYPRYSVSRNIGFDESGTHGGSDRYTAKCKFAVKPIAVRKVPVQTLPRVMQKMIKGYAAINRQTTGQQIKSKLRRLAGQTLPPIAKMAYQKIKGGRKASPYQGNYPSWQAARQACTGYDSAVILEKTLEVMLKVKNGEAVFERDTVLFDQPDYNWPLLTILLKAAAENGGQLSVLDFGGSLGSVYYQSRAMLEVLPAWEWSVVEQAHYIAPGNRYLADAHLKFYPTVESCLTERAPRVLLLSSVLQYLEAPYEVLSQLMGHGFDYMIIDRTTLMDGIEDRLTIQTVPDDVYKASYPAWFFNRRNLLNAFSPAYQVMAEFDPYPGQTIELADQVKAYYKGMIFQKTKDQ